MGFHFLFVHLLIRFPALNAILLFFLIYILCETAAGPAVKIAGISHANTPHANTTPSCDICTPENHIAFYRCLDCAQVSGVVSIVYAGHVFSIISLYSVLVCLLFSLFFTCFSNLSSPLVCKSINTPYNLLVFFVILEFRLALFLSVLPFSLFRGIRTVNNFYFCLLT